MSANIHSETSTASGKQIPPVTVLAPVSAADAHQIAEPGELVAVPLAPRTGSLASVIPEGTTMAGAEVKPKMRSVTLWLLTIDGLFQTLQTVFPQIERILPKKVAYVINVTLLVYVGIRRVYDNTVLR